MQFVSVVIMERLFSEVKLVNKVTAPCVYQNKSLKHFTRGPALLQRSCLGAAVSCTSEGSCGVADCFVLSQPGMELLVAPQHSPEHCRRPQLLHPARPLANPASLEFILWFLHLA